jgi:hypothetical protein
VRALALTPAVLLVTGATPAFAVAPEQWGEAPSVDPIHALLVIVLIPAGLFALITLLTYLPSMAKGEGAYHPGLAWRHEPEWFGGPRDGLEKADKTDPAAVEGAADRGGASGRW